MENNYTKMSSKEKALLHKKIDKKLIQLHTKNPHLNKLPEVVQKRILFNLTQEIIQEENLNIIITPPSTNLKLV